MINPRAFRLLAFNCFFKSVRDRGHIGDALIQVVMNEMGAKLKEKEVAGESNECEEQDHGNDRDEQVGDNEAIPQAPEQPLSSPAQNSNEQVARSDQEKYEKPAAEGRDKTIQGSQPKYDAKKQEGAGRSVEERR